MMTFFKQKTRLARTRANQLGTHESLEAKTLKVKLPKVLMNKLNELEKSAGVAADDMFS